MGEDEADEMFERIVARLQIKHAVVTEYAEPAHTVSVEITMPLTDNPESELFDAIAAYLDDEDRPRRPLYAISVHYHVDDEHVPKLRALFVFGEPTPH